MPVPKANESRKEFISRCIPIRRSEHPNEPNYQSTAVCFSIWKEHKKKNPKSSKQKEKDNDR